MQPPLLPLNTSFAPPSHRVLLKVQIKLWTFASPLHLLRTPFTLPLHPLCTNFVTLGISSQGTAKGTGKSTEQKVQLQVQLKALLKVQIMVQLKVQLKEQL